MDVSVIIVALNAADYIAKCVQSVEMQTGISCEAIVVDNGSKDGTLDKLKGLKCQVIASEKNLDSGRATIADSRPVADGIFFC